MVYSDLILSETGLVWYGRLGEPSGTTATDFKNNNSGTYHNCTLGQPGALVGDGDTAASFNGSSANVTIPHTSALNLGDVLTMECWCKRATTGSLQILMCYADNATFGLPVFLFTAADALALSPAGQANVMHSSTALTDTSSYHHCVVTKNGATRNVYIDGADVTVLDTNNPCTNSSAQKGIGSDVSPAPGAYFNGLIDEPAIYNVALSAAQVLSHYSMGLGLTPVPFQNWKNVAGQR